MNYLSHFVFNHEVCGLREEPHFVMGVALPDLWPRFSRVRRIRWRSVREAVCDDAEGTNLRAGLLNHVDADRRFHAMPLFLRWQREVRAGQPGYDGHPAVLDFLCHVAIELALDHHLVRADERLAERFYAHLESCDPALVEERITRVGQVDARGVGYVIGEFVRRRFLARYDRLDAVVDVIGWVLEMTRVPERPSRDVLQAIVESSIAIVCPERVWTSIASGIRGPTSD